MGRHAAVLQLYDGAVAKETKKENQDRHDAELRIGNDNYVMPPEIEENIDAMAEWFRIIALYKNAGLRITSSSDVNIISRYCLLHVEYHKLRKEQTELPPIAQTTTTSQGNIKIEETEEFLEWKNKDKLIMHKMEALLKLEDRLFLNPLAKFKNIPMIVKKDKKKEELEQLGFGNV